MVYAGIFGGMLLGVAGWYWYLVKQSAGNSNSQDEVLTYMATKSRSISWYFTMAAICLLFMLEVLNVSIGTIQSLGVLLFVHLGSSGIVSIILYAGMARDPEEAQKRRLPLIQKAALGVSVLILLIIVAILFIK